MSKLKERNLSAKWQTIFITTNIYIYWEIVSLTVEGFYIFNCLKIVALRELKFNCFTLDSSYCNSCKFKAISEYLLNVHSGILNNSLDFYFSSSPYSWPITPDYSPTPALAHLGLISHPAIITICIYFTPLY
jgi:nitric oxide reductase large subunit